MQFLLVALNAKYIHSNPALYSLRAYAGENASHVQIAEYTINNRPEDILSEIYKRRPDAIGFSCYIWNWSMIQDIVTELHKLMPTLPIWLGGPEVSFDGEDILKQFPYLAGIMVGEGEATFSEVLAHYLSGEKTLEEIAGLVLPQGATAVRAPLLMSEIPFLYNNLEDFKNRIIYYESQRGCPFRCSYCLSSIDKSVRLRNLDVVKKELQFFLDNKVSQVKFVDRTFNCNHNHAMEIWRYIHENDNVVTNFHFEIAGDILNGEEIELLGKMRPGLVQLEIGVQSTNEETLQEIRRVMDISKLKQVTETIRKGGNIHQHLDLIAGLPFENYERFGRSFNEVYAMKPHQLQLGFLKVLKGSYMHEKAEDYGLVYTDKPPYEVLYTKWLSYEDVCKLKKIEEMVELYYNSNQFTHTLPLLEKAFEAPFALYEALADFYEKKGLFVETPSRMYRYQVLLDFTKVYDARNEGLYKELLTYDLYLRENLKSRPGFAPDLGANKQEISAFYKQEETERAYLPDYAAYDGRQLARMTHLEPFAFSVWEEEVSKVTEESPACVVDNGSESRPIRGYVLFDYQNRSPLTHEARVCVIMPKQIAEAMENATK